MKTKFLISLVIISTLFLTFAQIQAKTSDTALEVEKMVNDVFLEKDPLTRLKSIKSTIKNESDFKKKILFMRGAISYGLKLQRDEVLKREGKDNLESFKFLYSVDGDTININNQFGNKTSIRLIGIDAPESSTARFGYKECYGEEAKTYLKELIGKTEYINLEFDTSQGKIDKYGRLLAYLWLNGKNLNEELIKNGYGFEYTYSKAYKYQDDFKKAQKLASNGNLGMWNSNACNGERKKIEEVNTSILNSNLDNSCGVKTYCSEMTSCEEARFYLNTCGLTRLDRDKDGIPCEALCGE